MINTRKTVESGNTPEKITLSMIDQDLKDGVSKADMAIKYSIKPWEVDEMFKHPFLKGRRPSRKKTLSFSFVDDMPEESMPLDAIKAALPEADEVDPNQVTLEQAIDEAIDTVTEVKDQMHQTQEAILDMLSPTEYETPEETLLKAAVDTPEITGIPNGNTMSDTDEEEIEMEDDTFTI